MRGFFFAVTPRSICHRFIDFPPPGVHILKGERGTRTDRPSHIRHPLDHRHDPRFEAAIAEAILHVQDWYADQLVSCVRNSPNKSAPESPLALDGDLCTTPSLLTGEGEGDACVVVAVRATRRTYNSGH